MKQMNFSFFQLLFCSLLQFQTSHSFCPNPTDLSPCQCKNSYVSGLRKLKYIDCSKNNQFDFASVFAKISEDSRVLDTYFEKLFLADSTITELPKRAIGQVKFQKIIIQSSCSNLKRIHQQAFESSRSTTRILSINDLDLDINATAPYSLLGLVNSFQRLEKLYIHNEFLLLQDSAFGKNLSNLTSLELKAAKLNGSPFYNLLNLSIIDLIDGNISYISSNTFKFRQRAADSLLINLSGNSLNDSSFEIGAFMNITGSVHLDLSRNQITYLDEQVFAPFLNAHQDNIIDIYFNPINCSDCRSYWLFQNENWKNNDKIYNSYCNEKVENGTIWENEEKFRYKCGINKTVTNSTLESKCPNPTLLSPCSCENNIDKPDISCKRNIDFNITEVFERISQKEYVRNSIYRQLVLKDNEIIELNEQATGLVRFEKIYVSYFCYNLKRIHYNAFQASSKTARSLVIGSLDLETNNSDNYSLIRLVNSFENLLTLGVFVNSSKLTILSNRVFSENLKNLSALHLIVHHIDGSPFYNLANLKKLALTPGTLNWIPSNAFNFSKRYNQTTLEISLRSNHLNSSSFEVGVFENIIGSVKLDLSKNQIDYLDEQIFSPFLYAHKDNQVILTGNPINCSDCQSFWMLKSENLKAQILNAHCNGITHLGTIWDKEDELSESCSPNSTTITTSLILTTQYPQTTSMESNQQNKIHPNKSTLETNHQDNLTLSHDSLDP